MGTRITQHVDPSIDPRAAQRLLIKPRRMVPSRTGEGASGSRPAQRPTSELHGACSRPAPGIACSYRHHNHLGYNKHSAYTMTVLIEVLQWLRRAGIQAEHVIVEGSAPDDPEMVDVVLGPSSEQAETRFVVEERRRAPYPNELSRLDSKQTVLSQHGQPLLIAPFIPETLGPALSETGWSWADAEGNFDLRAPGLMLRQRRATRAAKAKRRSLPQGSGSLAIIRALIRMGEEAKSGTTLAGLARVSQPRGSQVLHILHELGLVRRAGHGRWSPDREALLDRFLAEYSGPGGSEHFYHSLKAPTDVAVAAVTQHKTHGLLAVSADVGPDLLVPWRRPSLIALYTTRALDVANLGLVEATGPHDGNVIVRRPADRSVFAAPPLTAQVQGVDLPLADPSQMIWDMQDLGGADRLEGAGRVREWLLERR